MIQINKLIIYYRIHIILIFFTCRVTMKFD
jgi:hypothetical protein